MPRPIPQRRNNWFNLRNAVSDECQKSKTFERKFYGFKNIPNHFMQKCVLI